MDICNNIDNNWLPDINRKLDKNRIAIINGKLFVQFIALIFLSYIKRAMQGKVLFGKYTIQGLIDTLDVIECVGRPSRDFMMSEITAKQQNIYILLGVEPPASL